LTPWTKPLGNQNVTPVRVPGGVPPLSSRCFFYMQRGSMRGGNTICLSHIYISSYIPTLATTTAGSSRCVFVTFCSHWFNVSLSVLHPSCSSHRLGTATEQYTERLMHCVIISGFNWPAMTCQIETKPFESFFTLRDGP
jgi:hypothetical protein